MMKRWKLVAGTVALAAVMLTGCGQKDTADVSGKDMKILMTISQIDTFRGTLAEAAMETAEKAGGKVEVVEAGGSIEVQVQQIRDAAQNGYDAVLCCPVSADTAVELEAVAGDMPIIFMNSQPKDKRLEANKSMFVGSDEGVAGKLQAEYILERFGAEDEINIVLIKGERNHSATDGRTDAFKEALADSGKKINIVFEDCADWSDVKAAEMFEVFLSIGVPFDAVVCNNDAMALGVIAKCKENGIDLSKIPVLGIDATADGCQAIVDGDMAFTVYQSARGQGEAGVKVAMALANGQGAEASGLTPSEDGKYVWVPFEKVDSGNVAEYQ